MIAFDARVIGFLVFLLGVLSLVRYLVWIALEISSTYYRFCLFSGLCSPSSIGPLHRGVNLMVRSIVFHKEYAEYARSWCIV